MSTALTSSSTATLNLHGKRVVVMGLGRFGGGVGVTKFLVQRGASVLVTDTTTEDELRDSVAALAGLPVEFRLGRHEVEDFTHADLLVVNPAVKPAGNEFLQAAAVAGVEVTSEIRLLTRLLPNRARTIGVTGSAGKSTTTAMIGHILRRCLPTPLPPREGLGEGRASAIAETESPHHVSRASESRPSPSPSLEGRGIEPPTIWLGGNLGGSLLADIDRIRPDDWVVLELSSFMLEGLREDRWSPHVAVITNLSPNHIDWHGSLEGYRHAKQAILDFQLPDDFAVLGPGVSAHFTPRAQQVSRIESGDVESLAALVPELLIPGEHNRLNAVVAIEACDKVAESLRDSHRVAERRGYFAAALADFAGLPHRMQLVCERAGVRYFNDSKSTTPEAAMLAIQCFAPGTVHVILGGYDKGSDMNALAALAVRHCRAIYTIGATGGAIAQAARAAAASRGEGTAEVVPCETLAAALAATATRIHVGDVVLLSPACASWDQFTHFERRGAAFAEQVLLVTGEGAPPPAPIAGHLCRAPFPRRPT